MSEEREAAFVRWMTEEAKCIVGSADPYPAGIERRNRKIWNAAWRAARQSAGATRQEPVATVKDADEYGPIIEWEKHWVELIGANLYAAPIGDNGAKETLTAPSLAKDSGSKVSLTQQALQQNTSNSTFGVPYDGLNDLMAGVSQPAEIKRVEMTDAEILEAAEGWRYSTYNGCTMYSFSPRSLITLIGGLLARAQAKGG